MQMTQVFILTKQKQFVLQRTLLCLTKLVYYLVQTLNGNILSVAIWKYCCNSNDGISKNKNIQPSVKKQNMLHIGV